MLAAAEARQSAGGGEPTQGHRRLGGTIPGPRRWEGAGRQEPRGGHSDGKGGRHREGLEKGGEWGWRSERVSGSVWQGNKRG